MKTWLNNLFSSSTSVSSKRVFGAIGFIAMIIKVFKMNDSVLVSWTITLCVAMLGLETVVGVFKKTNQSPTKTEKDEQI